VSASAEELYSLLIPMADERMIVPRACVAEVIRYATPEAREGSADWFLGTLTWHGRELPIVSYERMLGNDLPETSSRTRIVAFHAGGGKVASGYFGLLTQGFPQLVRVNREVLRLASRNNDWQDDAPVLCRVKMINEYPLIPNIEELERRIGEEALQA